MHTYIGIVAPISAKDPGLRAIYDFISKYWKPKKSKRSKQQLAEVEEVEDSQVAAGDGSDSDMCFDYMAEAADDATDDQLRAALQCEAATRSKDARDDSPQGTPQKSASLSSGITDEFEKMVIGTPPSTGAETGPCSKKVIEISDSPVAVKKDPILFDERALKMARLRLLKSCGFH